MNGGDPLEDKSFTKNTETFDLSTPTRDGYSFLGWYGNSDLTGEKITQVVKGTEKNIEVWAKWQLVLAANTAPSAAQITANTDVKITFNNTANDDVKILTNEVRDALTSGKTLTIEDTSQNITWTFSGSDTKQTGYNDETAFDTAVEAHPDVENKKVVLDFNFDGTLPYQSTVRYLFGVEYAGQDVTAENSRTHELIGPYKVDAQGYVEFPIDHCSDWTIAVSYGVEFNANGGTVNGQPSVTSFVQYKTAVGTLPTAKRAGYNFLRWAVDANSPAVTEQTVITDNMTFVAVWEEITYTVTFDKNNNSATGVMNDEFTIRFTETKNLPQCAFEFTGHSATWNFRTDGTGMVFQPGGQISGAAVCEAAGEGDTAVLYAKWVPNKYLLEFNGNDGTSSERSKDVTYGQAVGALPTATRNGYNFTGWNTSADGSGTGYNSETVYNTAGGLTVYAQWEIVSYTINYNLNGGTNSNQNPATYTIADTVSLKSATRDGYAFKGWYDNAEFRGNRITQIGPDETGGKTLYANWGANNISVTFRVDGLAVGFDDVTVWSQTAHAQMGRQADNTSYIENSNSFPINDGTYTIKRGNDASGYTEIGQVTVSSGHGEETFYYYTVTYTAAGADDVPESEIVLSGETATEPQQNPSKRGHTFSKWEYIDEQQAHVAYVFSTPVTTPVHLYAKFNANQYTVTFKDGNDTIGELQISYGSEIEDVVPPTKQGFGFQGYFSGQDQYFDPEGRPMEDKIHWTILDDLTLDSHWGAQSVSVTFGIGNAVSATYGQPMPTLSRTYIPDAENGFRFIGYYDKAEGQQGAKKYYNADLSSAVQTSDLVQDTRMYAHYEKITLSVVFVLNGGAGNLPNDLTVQVGDTIEEPNVIPTRAGYTFSAWSLTSFAQTDLFEDGEYIVTSAHIGLQQNENEFRIFAMWAPEQYTVQYNANGGDGQVPASSSVKTGDTFSLPEFNTTKTVNEDRFFFGGWNTQADGQGTNYRGSVTFNDAWVALANGQNVVTLYVDWAEMEFTPAVGYTFVGTLSYGPEESRDIRMTVIQVGNQSYRVEEDGSNGLIVYEFPIGTYPVMNGYADRNGMIDTIKNGQGSQHDTDTLNINGIEKIVDVYTNSYTYHNDHYTYTLYVTADGFIAKIVELNTDTSVTATYQYLTHEQRNLQPATITYKPGGGMPGDDQVANNSQTFVSAEQLGITRDGYKFVGWATSFAVYKPGDAVTGARTVFAQWEEITNPRTNISWDVRNRPDGISFLIDGKDAYGQNGSQGEYMTVTGGESWSYDQQNDVFSFTVNDRVYRVTVSHSQGTCISCLNDNGRFKIQFGEPSNEDPPIEYWISIEFTTDLPTFGQYLPQVGDVFTYDDDGLEERLEVTAVNNGRYNYSWTIYGNQQNVPFGKYPGDYLGLLYPYPIANSYDWTRGSVVFNQQNVECYVIFTKVYEQYYENSNYQMMAEYNDVAYYIGVNDGLCYKIVHGSANLNNQHKVVISYEDKLLTSKPANMQTIQTYNVTMNLNGGSYNQSSNAVVMELSAPSNSIIPSKNNGDFIGWSLTQDGAVRYAYDEETRKFTPAYFQPADANQQGAITLYAKWDEGAEEYTLQCTGESNYSTTFYGDEQAIELPSLYLMGINGNGVYLLTIVGEAEYTYGPQDMVPMERVLECLDNQGVLTVTVELRSVKVQINANNGGQEYATLNYVFNQDFRIPDFGNPQYPVFEKDGYTAVGVGLTANANSWYEFGDRIPLNVMRNLEGDTIHLYYIWSDTAIRGYIFANFNNAQPDSITGVMLQGGEPMNLPSYEDVSHIWTYQGHYAAGFGTAADGNVVYDFEDSVTYQEISQLEDPYLYVIWIEGERPDPTQLKIYANDGGQFRFFTIQFDEEGADLPTFAYIESIWGRDTYLPIGLLVSPESQEGFSFGDHIDADVIEEINATLYVAWEEIPDNCGAIVANFDNPGELPFIPFTVGQSGNYEIPDADYISGFWANEGYVPGGLSTTPDGDPQYNLGYPMSVNSFNNLNRPVLYIVWEIPRITGCLYAGYDDANPEYYENVIEGSARLPSVSDVAHMWNYSGHHAIGFGIEQDGDVIYELRSEITALELMNMENPYLYVIWADGDPEEPTQYSVLYLSEDGNTLKNSSFKSDDVVYELISAEEIQYNGGYRIFGNEEGNGGSLAFGEEVDVEELIDIAENNTVTLYVLPVVQ